MSENSILPFISLFNIITAGFDSVPFSDEIKDYALLQGNPKPKTIFKVLPFLNELTYETDFHKMTYEMWTIDISRTNIFF